MSAKRIAALLLVTLSLLVASGTSSSVPGIQYPWRFAYVSDTHFGWAFGGTIVRNTYMFSHALDSMNVAGVDFLILGGDYSEWQLGSDPDWGANDSLAAWRSRYSFPWYPVLGNWDARDADTTATDANPTRNPYHHALVRWPGYFQGKDWYKIDHKNLRFIAINNITDYDTGSAADYRLNNPKGYGPVFAGGIPGLDWDGITVANSAQRLAVAGWLNRLDVGERWVFIAQHRPIFGGSDAGNTNRRSMLSSAKGYLKAFEDSLGTKRGVVLTGDQHLGLWFTVPLRDSAISATSGFYHIGISGAGGARSTDTTTAFSAGTTWLESYLSTHLTETRNIGRTTATWADTLSDAADAGRAHEWFWQLYTVYGDHILVQTFRVWNSTSVGCAEYTGEGHSILIDSRTIRRDVR